MTVTPRVIKCQSHVQMLPLAIPKTRPDDRKILDGACHLFPRISSFDSGLVNRSFRLMLNYRRSTKCICQQLKTCLVPRRLSAEKQWARKGGRERSSPVARASRLSRETSERLAQDDKLRNFHANVFNRGFLT